MTRAAARPAEETTAAPAKRLAEPARVRLGAAAETAPDVLRELAIDPSVTVRAAVAMNVAAPEHVDHLLLVDPDERVRTLLGRKLASLIPDLRPATRSEFEARVLRLLAQLVEDEAVRVRAAIADVVKDMPGAPRELILRLANDSALPVCGPVIRLSPLLTADDLLGLLASAASPGIAAAVAGRPGLPMSVADAIAERAEDSVIAVLLANRSAAIREATLDALIGRAGAHPEWHASLVRRPALSMRAARALAGIVATQLVAELAARGDLDPEIVRMLQERVAARLPRPLTSQADPSLQEAVARTRALQAEGGLDEAAVLAAARRGEARTCIAMLAAAADVDASVVDRAVTLRSAKAIVSLVWKAGFSARAAGPLQLLLCRVGPSAGLRAGAGGAFPLAVEEMRWQLEFLKRMGR